VALVTTRKDDIKKDKAKEKRRNDTIINGKYTLNPIWTIEV
jgi:hypothetical protein